MVSLAAVSNDVLEIYFGAGAHTHIRQRWRLLGYTAELENEEAIEWNGDPRMKKKRRTRRCGESEPADSLRDKSSVSGGWLRSLTFALDAVTTYLKA